MDMMKRIWQWLTSWWRKPQDDLIFDDVAELEAAPPAVEAAPEPVAKVKRPGPVKLTEIVCPMCSRTVPAWRTYASGLRVCLKCSEGVHHA